MVYTIKTGDKISITEAEHRRWRRGMAEGMEERIEYISQVEEVIGETTVIALVPIYHGRLTRLPESVKYNLVFYTKSGMVKFLGKVESYFKENNLFFMRVKLLNKGESIQQRQFFRFDCSLPIRYNIIDGNEDYENPDDTPAITSGLIRDISGGGIALMSNETMKVNQRLKCQIMLGHDYLIIIGKIVNIKQSNNSNFKYVYNVMYSGITGADQERIVKYIFNEQRAILRATR